MFNAWHEHIFSSTGRPTGVANYLLLLLGFRCLLERLLAEAQSIGDAGVIPDEAAMPFSDFVSFMEKLNNDELRGYFLMSECIKTTQN